MRLYTESQTGRRRLRLPLAIGLFALVLFSPVLMLLDAEQVSWIGLGVGGLAFGLPGAVLTWTGVGEGAIEWFDRIGVVARALVIVGLAAAIWTTMWLGAWPVNRIATLSFVVGGMLAILAVDLVDRWRDPSVKER
jgi:hypothetical protein